MWNCLRHAIGSRHIAHALLAVFLVMGPLPFTGMSIIQSASDISYDCTCSDHLLLMTNERMVKAYSTVVVVLHPLRDAVPLCLNMQAAKCVAKSTRHSEGAHITPHCACPVS